MGFWSSALGWAEEITKGVSKLGIPGISQAAGLLTFAADRAKDISIDLQLGNLATDIGDLKNGLEGANAKIEAQGKALKGAMDGMKTELEGAIQQQGEKFDKEIKNMDKKIATVTGQAKKDLEKEREARKNEMAKQKQELESQIKEVTNQLEKAKEELKKELDDFKADVEKRFEEQEHKIKANTERIRQEEEARKAEIREVKDKIKMAQQKTENLRQEHQEFKEQSEQKQHEIKRKMEDIQQDFEDYQAETDSKIKVQQTKYEADLEEVKEEFETKSKNIDAKISDTQEQLAEHEEDLANVKYEQKKQNILNQELFENVQETNDILFAQQRKLNLVSQQMEDIQEEVHNRMDKISKEVNRKTQETLNIAKDATKKVDRLTKEVSQMRDDLENIEEQIQKNKEETEKIKQQAKQTNQRLDNLLKTQALTDYSAEQSNLDKIQKSLELKAEEAKLIATLNLLKETKNLVHLTANKEWLVGIKSGTETDKKGSEGFLLDPNSSWAKQYSKEQLQEWGWDTRLFGEHEKAQLLSEDQDKKQQEQEAVQSQEQEGEEVPVTEQAQQVLEEVNKVQTEILQKLSTIQEEIAANLTEVESAPPPPPSAPKPSATTALEVIKAESKVKIKKKALERQKQVEKEARQRAASSQTKQNQKQVQQEFEETKKAEAALSQAQEELSSLEKKQEFEEVLEEKEKELEENKSEEINLQWQQIQALSQQALQENPDHEKPEETKEEELEKKLEELVQQLQEQEVAQAASQKTMTLFMLYLIIFLMEYVVYKKNGLPGLIVLNILLLLCYWYKDQIMEYADLWSSYLLIIAYVAGNVLAYNSTDNPDYKMPMVYGFNAVVGLVYAYTYWQRLGGKQLAAKTYQQSVEKLKGQFKINTEEWEQIHAKTSPPAPNNWMERIKNSVSQSEYNVYSDDLNIHTQELANFQNFVQQREEAEKKEAEMTKQAETLQKAAEMEQQLKDNLTQAQAGLKEPLISWQLIQEKYPEFKSHSTFLTELAKSDKLIDKEFDPQELKELREWLEDLENKPEEKWKVYLPHFTEEFAEMRKRVLEKLQTIKTKSILPQKLPPVTEKEMDLLDNLELTLEQCIAISLQTPYLNRESKEFITNNYLHLSRKIHLELLKAGLGSLGVNTYEKLLKFYRLIEACQTESEEFGLTVKEKENILKFMMNTLNLNKEQQEKLEEMGVKPYNASEWTITEEQKDHLLDFGINKLTLTEEQTENLTQVHPDQFKTFALTGEQKNILNSLAPLIREDKYSLEALELLKSLHLKPRTTTFLVQEEIIPDPNTSFGTAKSSYLPLKEKFLKGEQKTLRKIKELEEKQEKEEEIRQRKLSILRSLMEFAQENSELNRSLPLFKEKLIHQEKEINRSLLSWKDRKILEELETEEVDEDIKVKKQTISTQLVTQEKISEDWVSVGALNTDQANILLTLGFKTIPKYNFFELLIFAIKNFETEPMEDNQEPNQQIEEIKTQILIILDAWRDKSAGKQKEAVKKAIKQLSNDKISEEQQFNRMKILLNQYPSDNMKLNNLVTQWKDIQQPITGSLVLYLEDNPNLKASYQEWINSCKNQEITINKEIWDKYAATPRVTGASRENLYELVDERVKSILGSYEPPINREEEIIESTGGSETSRVPKETKSSNKYDDLLANLAGEERERERKRLEREESRKKLEEAELARRQSKLSEKDRKLKEEAERRQKEKELAEQEEKKREEARIAREQALREEQENFLKTQQKNLEEKQKKYEENFANQIKEAELAEAKKKADLEELERQNKFNKEQFEKNIKLLEEEAQRKLEKIAHDDLKARVEIEKKRRDDEAALKQRVAEEEQELLNQKRKKEDELNKLKEKNRLDLEKAQQDLEAKKKKDAEELVNLGKVREQQVKEAQQELEKLKARQAEEEKINQEKIRNQAEKEKLTSKDREKFAKLNRIWNYIEHLIKDSTIFQHDYNEAAVRYRGERITSLSHIGEKETYEGWTYVHDLWKRYPGIEINFAIINKSGRHSWTWESDKAKNAYDKFINGVLGNRFYTEEQIKQEIKKIQDVNFVHFTEY